MGRIKVKNFGPIKDGMREEGWIDLGKVTLFIGCQGSGKSTVAKLVSIFSWLEKALVRGDYRMSYYTQYHRFRKKLCAYHRIENYFQDHTLICYEGDHYCFTCEGKENLCISPLPNSNEGERYLSKILYIPSDRNVVSTIDNYKVVRAFPESLYSFASDFEEAKTGLKEGLSLPLQGIEVNYNKRNDTLYIQGEDYKVQLRESSSGALSLVPLYLVVQHFSSKVARRLQEDQVSGEMSMTDRKAFNDAVKVIWASSLTDEQKKTALSEVGQRFTPQFLVTIMEEPEQNLYPTAQRDLLFRLLTMNNQVEANRLLLTTHSPYLLNYLTIIAKASIVKEELDVALNKNNELVSASPYLERIDEIIPVGSITHHEQIKIYEYGDPFGAIRLLETHYGVPSSSNLLNEGLRESNEYIEVLLDIEEELEQLSER